MMEEVFFKSALREGGPHLLDSSLALPAEPGPRSPTAASSTNRSLRVQQQVQLTLARRARRSESNGRIYCQRKSTKIFDAADGPGANMKPNRTDCSYSSLSSRHLRRPSRRVEVSPPSSPEVPRGHVNHSSLRYGTYAHSGHAPSLRWGTTMNRPFGCDSFHRYAFSEAPRVPQLHTTSAALGRFHQISHRQTVGPPPPPPPPVFTNAEFHHSAEFGSFLSRDQTAVGQEKHRTFGLNGDVMLGAVHPDEGVSWLAQVRRGRGQSLRRMKSYPPSNTSVEVDMGRQVEVEVPVQIQTMTLKSADRPPDMTLERAVNLLTQDNEDTLISAAGHIQNQCLRGAEAKKIVFYLRGIEKLLQLLCSDNEEVQRVAAGALRNVVYQSSENKMEVKENDGLANILQTLKNSRDVETRRDLTGLLWNLSSHDLLKEHLSREALPVLTRSVLVPSSGLSEGENPKDQLLADDHVFHNATGCLRNLSSSGPDGRKAMRACEDLIDSLVYYIRGAIADYKTDDKVSALKSTENCVCILHNLSYQMEAELPQLHSRHIRESRQSLAPKPKDVGCFAHRGAKISENPERQCPLLEEKANPRGMEWLWSSITIRMYLSLMARSVRHCTQEAAIGALQNITAGNGELIESITFTIVQRENGLHHVKRMLEEGQSDVKRTAIALIKNISCYQELQPSIVKEVLPELVEMLPDDDTGADRPTEVTVSLCNILSNLSQNRQHVRAIVGEGALPKIINISTKDSGYGPTRAGQAACVLLHSMWRHTDLHGAYRKCGYRKADFINSRTSKAVSSG